MRKTPLLGLSVLLLFTVTATAQTAPAQSQRPAALQSETTRQGPVAWDKISGNWKTFRGKLRQRWGKLTKNDLQAARGRRDILVGRIQARYGIDKDKADAQVEAWLKAQK
jgi:uncharacterized protein YjbJ (UPF0337 family)